MRVRGRHLGVALGLTLCASTALVSVGTAAGRPRVERIVYDSFDGDYDLGDYAAHWANPYGPGELAAGGTRQFDGSTVSISALPFQTGVDLSVFDHIKYLAVSNDSFAVPRHGSVTFTATIDATVQGTEPDGRLIHGVYGPPGCADDPACAAAAEPWSAVALEGQQAGATLHMIDFATGQLFDWFVSGSTAFALVERLPDNVVMSGEGGTRETMYTQIVKEVPISDGPQTVGITFTRNPGTSHVDYTLNGVRIARVQHVGVPLDVQHVPYTGIYPSLGAGEPLADQIDSVTIGHGLFSLLDAFPFQHPEAPELSVSIPISERLFGQGAGATFDNFIVTTETRPAG